ncbi:STAS domain-containing protein [bacterium]|nr:STAS domain-containing protein [bacterium]
MNAKVKMVDDVAVLTVKGNLMGGSETDSCHMKVKELLEEKTKKIVADLSHVKWVNSKGLGMLMACLTSSKNSGGVFKICGASEKVNSLLMITKLITIFECFDTVDEAVASFRE